MTLRRLLILLAVAALAAAVAVPATAAVKPPRSGAQFEGLTRQQLPITIYIAGRSVDYISFRFECGSGRTAGIGLQAIKLRKTRKGYRFASKAYGATSMSDDSPGENAQLTVKGRFSRSGRAATGTVRVKSRICGDTGTIAWRVRR